MRVVSLVPSVTETLLDWEVEVVGCTRFCEQPEIRHVGGTKDPDIAAIVGLRPDLVVVDTEENNRPDHDALVAAGLRVAVTSVCSLADVDAALATLAASLGRARPPSVVPSVVEPASRRAFVPIWRRPWMTVNARTYVADALRSVGVLTTFAEHTDRYPVVDDADIAAAAPDLVVAPDEPFRFGERHRAELEVFAPTTFLDGKLVTWWGSRTPDRLRELCVALG